VKKIHAADSLVKELLFITPESGLYCVLFYEQKMAQLKINALVAGR